MTAAVVPTERFFGEDRSWPSVSIDISAVLKAGIAPKPRRHAADKLLSGPQRGCRKLVPAPNSPEIRADQFRMAWAPAVENSDRSSHPQGNPSDAAVSFFLRPWDNGKRRQSPSTEFSLEWFFSRMWGGGEVSTSHKPDGTSGPTPTNMKREFGDRHRPYTLKPLEYRSRQHSAGQAYGNERLINTGLPGMAREATFFSHTARCARHCTNAWELGWPPRSFSRAKVSPKRG